MSEPKWKQNGEWSAFQPPGKDSEDRAVVRMVYRDENGLRCTQFLAICNSTLTDNLANATLFAAAPELYEALQDVLKWTEQKYRTLPWNMVAEQIEVKVRAAMAKARGEV